MTIMTKGKCRQLHQYEWPPEENVLSLVHDLRRGAGKTAHLILRSHAMRSRTGESDWRAPLSQLSPKTWVRSRSRGHSISRSVVGRSKGLHPEKRAPRFKNLDWFVENLNDIAKDYADKWIAIWEDQIVAAADSPKELLEKVKTTGHERALFVCVARETWEGYR